MRITSVAVIQGPEGDKVGNIVEPMTGEEITKVMKMGKRFISSMAVDHIVMVNTGHGQQDIRMSNCWLMSGTITELVFEKEDFATCSAQEDLLIERLTRRDKGGKCIIMGILSINMDNIVEEDGYGWSSKSKAGDSEPLE